jgi:hypothetical protein
MANFVAIISLDSKLVTFWICIPNVQACQSNERKCTYLEFNEKPRPGTWIYSHYSGIRWLHPTAPTARCLFKTIRVRDICPHTCHLRLYGLQCNSTSEFNLDRITYSFKKKKNRTLLCVAVQNNLMVLAMIFWGYSETQNQYVSIYKQD